jgi:hypothetical protein
VSESTTDKVNGSDLNKLMIEFSDSRDEADVKMREVRVVEEKDEVGSR